MNIERLVDRFVEHVNAGDREEMDPDEVPSFLRDGESEWGVRWKIVKADNSTHVAALTGRLPQPLPPSFQYFVSNYSFPAFEIGDLMLFANTGQLTPWEMSERILADWYMSPVLLKAGSFRSAIQSSLELSMSVGAHGSRRGVSPLVLASPGRIGR